MRKRSGILLPKIESLPGTLQAERKRCGKRSCRCGRGEFHGPYLYRRWRRDGKQRKQYVKATEVARVQGALEEWHRLHPTIWGVRSQLAELRRLFHQGEA